MMMTIQEFCDRHVACREGREWALAHCADLHDVWRMAKPYWLLWVATRPGVLTGRDLRLFACWSVRQAWHLLSDQRRRDAVEVAKRFAVGEASEEELSTADMWEAARAAAWEAATAAACAAAAEWSASWEAARAAATPAAWKAARAAACAAAAKWSAAWEASWEAHAAYLRERCTPNFEGGNV